MTNETIGVPCGKCPNCYKRRVSGWSFRLLQEDKVSTSSYFLTLTYDTKFVPITANGFMSLKKRDVQLFMKRLRKLNVNTKLKYYACGEYGGKTMRPHYHIIIFNAMVETFAQAWQLGQIHYGQVSEASVGYSLKYMSKPSKIPLHKNDDRTKEFGLMSKGLGIGYLSERMIKWHHADKMNRMYLNIEGGKKVSMPRYYKNKIYHELERKAIGIKTRQEMLVQISKDMEDPMYWRNKYEADKAAFEKMGYDQRKRSKI